MLARMRDHDNRPRRRRLSTSPDAISWASYIVLMIKRHYHWVVLAAVLAGIFLIGMGAPLLPVDDWMAFWSEFV